MDNLRVHKVKNIQKFYEDHNILPIWNVPYSPQYNGIESYWSLVKHEYKNLLLKEMIRKNEFKSADLVEQSIKKIKKEFIVSCA